MAERPTQEIPARDLEAMVRISAQLELKAEPLRAELRRLMVAVEDRPHRLWTGTLLGILVDVLLESHPKYELAGAVIGIGVAMFWRPGADLTPILELVTNLWADFEKMSARKPEPELGAD
jgi:hypothetical protein